MVRVGHSDVFSRWVYRAWLNKRGGGQKKSFFADSARKDRGGEKEHQSNALQNTVEKNQNRATPHTHMDNIHLH